MPFPNELNVSYQYDFLLFGIVSQAKDYKLAWAVNQGLQLRLVKAKDIKIDFHKDQSIVISNFIFKTTHCTFRLLKNKSWSAQKSPNYLLPDQTQIDYLLMIKDATETITTGEISAKLKSVPDIDSFTLFDVNTLLFKDNLIF